MSSTGALRLEARCMHLWLKKGVKYLAYLLAPSRVGYDLKRRILAIFVSLYLPIK